MSLETIASQLRALPFSDMMVLAGYVRAEMERRGPIDAMRIAEILVGLTGKVAPAPTSEQELRLLKNAFNRKRVINVRPRGQQAGWEIDCPTLAGSSVVGTDLRVMMPQMLDQIIVLEAMHK